MKRVPDILVERLRLGELPPAEAARVRARLEAAGELHRLDALDADDRAILAQHPRPNLPALAPIPPRVPPALALTVAALVTASVVFLVVRAQPSEDDTRVKGGDIHPVLLVYRQTAEGYDVVEDNALVKQGDVLQLAYVAAGRKVGLILSTDGREHTTVHLPAQVLQQGGEVRLGQGYALDDAPAFERFTLITFDDEVEQATVTVRK